MDDMIVGVLYGENLSANYRTIATTYPVYCGAEFWEHLTGDNTFYYKLAKAFGEVVEEKFDEFEILPKLVRDMAEKIMQVAS